MAPDWDDCHGCHIVWSGWREPVNQAVRVGFWAARRPGSETYCYATTLGTTGVAGASDVIDLSWADRSAPINPLFDAPERFEAAKQQAKARLVEFLQ